MLNAGDLKDWLENIPDDADLDFQIDYTPHGTEVQLLLVNDPERTDSIDL